MYTPTDNLAINPGGAMLTDDVSSEEKNDAKTDLSFGSTTSENTKVVLIKSIKSDPCTLFKVNLIYILTKNSNSNEENIKKSVYHQISSIFCPSLAQDCIAVNLGWDNNKYFTIWYNEIKNNPSIKNSDWPKFVNDFTQTFKQKSNFDELKDKMNPFIQELLQNISFYQFLISEYIKNSDNEVKILEEIGGGFSSLKSVNQENLSNLNIKNHIVNILKSSFQNKLNFKIDRRIENNLKNDISILLKEEQENQLEKESVKNKNDQVKKEEIGLTEKKLGEANSVSKSYFNIGIWLIGIAFFSSLAWVFLLNNEQDVCSDVEGMLLKDDVLYPKGGRMHGGHWWDQDRIGSTYAEKYITDCHDERIRNYLKKKYRIKQETID